MGFECSEALPHSEVLLHRRRADTATHCRLLQRTTICEVPLTQSKLELGTLARSGVLACVVAKAIGLFEGVNNVLERWLRHVHDTFEVDVRPPGDYQIETALVPLGACQVRFARRGG